MKKNMVVKIVVAVAAVVLLLFGGWYVMFTRFGIGPGFPFLPTQEISIGDSLLESRNLAEAQLMAFVLTQEDAESIAQQYDIELVSFSDGVASYRTEEDPDEVIARGRENGYPEIYLNYKRTMH